MEYVEELALYYKARANPMPLCCCMLAEDLPIVSIDAKFDGYGVKRIW